MKNLVLSPFVYKVRGAKNYLFHDLYREKIFHLSLEDISISQLKENLISSGLAFETEGVIPFKYKIDANKMKNTVELIELEIRLTNICFENCPDCGKLCGCFLSGESNRMTEDVLKSIIDNFGEGPGKIPVKNLVITGGNPFLERESIDLIFGNIDSVKKYIIFNKSMESISHDNFTIIKNRKRGVSISEAAFECDDFSFFFRQNLHSCWGKKLCIDVGGEVKLCQRHSYTFGNVLNNNVKQLIMNGVFDHYWELTKDEIATCCDCEYRYSCFECRPHIEADLRCIEKPKQCGYNPYTGEWKEPIIKNIL